MRSKIRRDCVAGSVFALLAAGCLAVPAAESLRSPINRYVFNVRASYFAETDKIVEQMVNLGLTKIAVFYQNDAYGQAGLAGVERAVKKRNLAITVTGTVERNTIDVAAAVKTIAKTEPQAVVMISAYKSCAAFIREMKKAGSVPQFINVSFVGSRALATMSWARPVAVSGSPRWCHSRGMSVFRWSGSISAI
ncbi:MAG: ABC transporter substrate-binding protein [Casimicrobiaceae bacterium]